VNVPLYLLCPLFGAAIYALSSLFLKRALSDGVSVWQTVHVSNLMIGAVTLPLFFMQRGAVDWGKIYEPLMVGACFFLGGVATSLAVRHGDVSLVTPLMGTKVVFVALGTMAMLGEKLPPLLIVAAGLTTVGIFVLGIPDLRGGKKFWPTVGITLFSAALFGFCDVLTQRWAEGFGRLAFVGCSSNGVALISLLFVAGSHVPGRTKFAWPGKGQRFWIWTSAFLVAFQAVMVGVSLASFDDATGINVVYASRGLWAIVWVALIGHWFANRERVDAGRMYLWRVAGAGMLTTAVILAVIARARMTA